MKANFKVGDRVRRTEGDNEIGIISLIDGGNVLVDFNRFTIIVQRFIKLSDLEPLADWETIGDRVLASATPKATPPTATPPSLLRPAHSLSRLEI
jgi:hypothetical protein